MENESVPPGLDRGMCLVVDKVAMDSMASDEPWVFALVKASYSQSHFTESTWIYGCCSLQLHPLGHRILPRLPTIAALLPSPEWHIMRHPGACHIYADVACCNGLDELESAEDILCIDTSIQPVSLSLNRVRHSTGQRSPLHDQAILSRVPGERQLNIASLVTVAVPASP